MIKEFKEFSTNALLLLADEELLQSYTTSKPIGLYTFIWAKDNDATLEVDGIESQLEKGKLLVLTPNQYFKYTTGNNILVYQFNREFYCIKDHDKEVGCVGILFHSNNAITIIDVDHASHKKLEQLHLVFLDEFDTIDTIQAEMLRMLMTRFIITITRLIKEQNNYPEAADQHELLRDFNILVDTHFRTEHSVKFYADKLFKSPKTLSNNFSKIDKSPLQIIHKRIIQEAKRLLIYSDKTAKEIAFEIGFEDASHLSRMFKKHTNVSPTEFKKNTSNTPV